MARNNKRAIRKLVGKLDRASLRLEFNQAYPDVVKQRLEEKYRKIRDKKAYAAKKKLLPLELETFPEAEKNEYLREKELDRERESQKLPRRAVQQTYLANVETSGEEVAAKVRDEQLAKLDRALDTKRAQLEARYPVNAQGQPTAEAMKAFEEATRQKKADMDALIVRQEAAAARKLEKVQKKMDRQNAKLQAEFDSTHKKVCAMSKITEERFGKDNILHIEGLKMYFSGVKAVDDISFDVKQGEIFGLIGPNGAGKTTVFNCITQFYFPTAGNIYYRDRYNNLVDLTDYRAHDIVRAGISRTFQNLELVYYLTVEENLLVGAHANYDSNLAHQFLHTSKLHSEDAVFRAKAQDLLSRLGILEYKDVYPFGLPYGVLKKVELARTLLSSPKLIILDEPAAGLNDAETEELAETIRKIRDDFHCTILLVEHDMNLVMDVCDTVCAISFGKLLAVGAPEDIQENKLVQEAYLGTE